MINALFAAIPGIGNVLVVSVLFWLIFSIVGVQLFSGKFQACYDHDDTRLPASVIKNKTECLRFADKYTWKNADVNFDNVPKGFLALFQVVSWSVLLLHYNSVVCPGCSRPLGGQLHCTYRGLASVVS